MCQVDNLNSPAEAIFQNYRQHPSHVAEQGEGRAWKAQCSPITKDTDFIRVGSQTYDFILSQLFSKGPFAMNHHIVSQNFYLEIGAMVRIDIQFINRNIKYGTVT